MKTCKKCNTEKPFGDFYKRKDSKDGYRNECKKCKDLIAKKYSENNIEKVKQIKDKYYLSNKSDVIERTKKWQNDNKKRHEEINDKYKNKKSTKERYKNYYLNNKEYYYLKNKEYKENNKLEINKKLRDKYKNDILFKIKSRCRNIITKSIKRSGYKKESRTEEILGCSFEYFKNYIENKFEDWMSWDNYGLYNGNKNYGWDIDHIIPLSSVITEDDIYNLSNYKNLQPLCSKINRDIKKDNINYILSEEIKNYCEADVSSSIDAGLKLYK
jgi:hypothetical protein